MLDDHDLFLIIVAAVMVAALVYLEQRQNIEQLVALLW